MHRGYKKKERKRKSERSVIPKGTKGLRVPSWQQGPQRRQRRGQRQPTFLVQREKGKRDRATTTWLNFQNYPGKFWSFFSIPWCAQLMRIYISMHAHSTASFLLSFSYCRTRHTNSSCCLWGVSAIAVLGFLFPFFVKLMSIVNDECKVNFVLSEILQFIIFFLSLNCKILINFALSVTFKNKNKISLFQEITLLLSKERVSVVVDLQFFSWLKDIDWNFLNTKSRSRARLAASRSARRSASACFLRSSSSRCSSLLGTFRTQGKRKFYFYFFVHQFGFLVFFLATFAFVDFSQTASFELFSLLFLMYSTEIY